MKNLKKALVAGLATLLSTTLKGMPICGDSIPVATVYFNQGSSELLESFRHNADSLAKADSLLKAWAPLQIVVAASASPEGAESYNQLLSRRRALSVARYLGIHLPETLSARIRTIVRGAEWPSSTQLEEADSSIADRDRILEILNSHYDNAEKQRMLGNLNRGKALKDLINNVYPDLRRAVIYAQRDETLLSDTTRSLSIPADTAQGRGPVISEQTPIESTDYQLTVTNAIPPGVDCNKGLDRKFAIKTNTLYWLALTPNVEAELFVARRWSVNLEAQYGWWADNKRHHYWRIAAVSPEVRYWFAPGKGYFSGHFAGVYMAGGVYEFMFRPQYGLQGEVYLSGGFTYGYTLPLGCSFAMEFSVSIGYLHTSYKDYHWNGSCYKYDATQKLNYFGPTKAKITLMWRFGKGGGRR